MSERQDTAVLQHLGFGVIMTSVAFLPLLALIYLTGRTLSPALREGLLAAFGLSIVIGVLVSKYGATQNAANAEE